MADYFDDEKVTSDILQRMQLFLNDKGVTETVRYSTVYGKGYLDDEVGPDEHSHWRVYLMKGDETGIVYACIVQEVFPEFNYQNYRIK